MKFRKAFILAFFGAACLLAVPPEAGAYYCMFSISDAPKDVPQFEDFPADVDTIDEPAPVDLTGNPEARRFRTALSLDAVKGPNFAGHYTIAGWGCGMECSSWAIVDALTGRVFFPKNFKWDGGHNIDIDDIPPDNYYGLLYRRDSKLLIVLGEPQSEPAREGIAYLLWNGSSLKQLRFVPRASLPCRSP
jgi:hypothetical protein